MADNTSSIAGLFMTPELYQQQQDQNALAQAAQLAQMTGRQRADLGWIGAGQQVARGLAGALGAQDPQMKLASLRQSVLQGVDQTDATSLRKAAQSLADAGDLQGANALAQQSVSIQAKIDEKQMAREQALQMARERIAAQIEIAKQRGEDQKSIAQMQIEGRKELAAIAAALKQGPNKPLTTQDIKMANDLTASVKDANYGINEADRFTKMLDEGIIKFGAVENMASKARALASKSNESDVAKSDMEKWITSSINAVLNQAKGVQAKDDAERAQRQIMDALDKNDPKLVKNGVMRIKKLLENTKDDAVSGLELMSQERNRDLTSRATSGNKADPLGIR